MKLIRLCLYVAINTFYIDFCASSFNACDSNLIRNPGFDDAKTLKFWKHGGPINTMLPEFLSDKDIFVSKPVSLHVVSKNPNAHGYISQKMSVFGGKTYRAEVNFRTSGVEDVHKAILIRIKWFKDTEQTGTDYIGNYFVSDEWYLASANVLAPPGSDSAEIFLVFRWSLGEVWWDNIRFFQVKPEPERKVRLSTVYCLPPGPDVQGNIDTMAFLLDIAGQNKSDIVCLPEGWPTYNTSIYMGKNESNTLEGSASRMMAEKAKQHKMYIVSGLYTWHNDTLYNSAVLYNRNGEIKYVYRKVQLPDSETEQGAVPGNNIAVVSTDFGNIGMLVCWDLFFPEVSRILALKGAEVLLCPIWGDNRGQDVWKVTARSRAIDNGVYLVTSTYDGKSLIIDPAGDILQESNLQGSVITSEIDLNFNPEWIWLGNKGRSTWRTLWRKDRRNDLYNF